MVFKTDYRLMQVKSIVECSKEHSAILSNFIKLPFVIKTFILSIFEWLFYTGFTVHKTAKCPLKLPFFTQEMPKAQLHSESKRVKGLQPHGMYKI